MTKQTIQPKKKFIILFSTSLFALLFIGSKIVLADSVANLNNEGTSSNLNGSISGSIFSNTSAFGTQHFPDRPVHCKTVTLTPEPSVDIGAGIGMPIVTVTDVSGQFTFNDLPNNDNVYTLSVDNVNSDEAELHPIADPDSTPDLQVDVTLDFNQLTASNQDFLVDSLIFTVLNGVGGELFGDNDGDGMGTATDNDIMLSDVVVSLSIPSNLDLGNGAGQPITTTTTSDGYYLFDNLIQSVVNSCYPQSLIYTVVVDTTTLPAPYDSIPSYDPDGVFDAQAVIDLSISSHEEMNFSFVPLTVTTVGMTESNASTQANPAITITFTLTSSILIIASYGLFRFKDE